MDIVELVSKLELGLALEEVVSHLNMYVQEICNLKKTIEGGSKSILYRDKKSNRCFLRRKKPFSGLGLWNW